METLNNGKAKVSSSINNYKIAIPSKKNWFVLLFGTAWLGGWFFGLTSALKSFEFGSAEFNQINGFMTFWLIGWIIGGLFVISLLLWGYFGKEIFDIQNSQIEFRKHILGLGKNRILKKSEVKNIRYSNVEINYFSGTNKWALWGIGEGKIKFDYGMKTYSLGLGLDDAEANYLVEQINNRLNK